MEKIEIFIKEMKETVNDPNSCMSYSDIQACVMAFCIENPIADEDEILRQIGL